MTTSITSYGVHNIGALAFEDAPNMGAFEDAEVFLTKMDPLFARAALSGNLAATPSFTAELGVTIVSS